MRHHARPVTAVPTLSESVVFVNRFVRSPIIKVWPRVTHSFPAFLVFFYFGKRSRQGTRSACVLAPRRASVPLGHLGPERGTRTIINHPSIKHSGPESKRAEACWRCQGKKGNGGSVCGHYKARKGRKGRGSRKRSGRRTGASEDAAPAPPDPPPFFQSSVYKLCPSDTLSSLLTHRTQSTIVNGILLVIAFVWINFLAVRSLERDRSRLLYDLYDDDEGGACGGCAVDGKPVVEIADKIEADERLLLSQTRTVHSIAVENRRKPVRGC